MGDGVPRVQTVGVLAPSGRDAPLTAEVLARWGIRAQPYFSMDALVNAIERGIGVVILAEETLTPRAKDRLVGTLGQQPSWSDIPIIVLTGAGDLSAASASAIDALADWGNVTLLRRPVRVATLVTVVRSALRARGRQYDVHEHLQSLTAARAEAEEANRAKLDFLAMMSHELRTPLNAIGGYAELLEMGIRGPMTDEQRSDLAKIQKSQRHLLGLINGLLNYARIESGRVQYDVAIVPMDELLATAEALVAPQARARGLHLIYAGCGENVRARADREKTQQVVLNLLTNAVKFTEGGGEVRMGCDSANGSVIVRVSDTGRGIPADKLDSIFEPFIQVDSRLTRTQEGVGLGLSISRELAHGMGGDLVGASTPGVGSTFTLSLPAA